MSTSTSRRQLIIEWFQSALAGITVIGGYRTNAGQALYVGASPDLGGEEETGDPSAAIALLIGTDAVKRTGGKVQVVLPIKVACLSRALITADAWEAVEAMVADVKEVIELPAQTLVGSSVIGSLERGPTNTADREPGSLTVGAEIEYLVSYCEAWGAP